MHEKEIEKKICQKFEGMEESVKYQLDALCELSSGLKEIQYLMFLKDAISSSSQESLQ
ncbi:MAG: hypothetical protein LBJ74_04625 [Heliobacteriaceae bacterium]|jgi:hypothetical protein|nr:hypothetical protein [Heliobacteriaceae bacterium]